MFRINTQNVNIKIRDKIYVILYMADVDVYLTVYHVHSQLDNEFVLCLQNQAAFIQ